MTSTSQDDIFDIIIIGGGTAGSVLAARLSSNPTFHILVLEAGQNRNEDPNVKVPGLGGNLLGNPTYDWKFQTSPEAGLNGRVINQPRGKMWGGSSAINSHSLVFPSRGYHDAWDSLLERRYGAPRWDWEGVEKYYTKFLSLQKPSEDVKEQLDIGNYCVESQNIVEGNSEKAENEINGVQASFPGKPHVLQKAWSGAIEDMGYNTQKDPRTGAVVGGSTTFNAIDATKGERSHSGIAFLGPSTKRENLEVRSNVLVEKILFDEEKFDGKLVATGVLYHQDGNDTNLKVHARKEVIICAGTFGSPKVLELSGIGKREVLSGLGIECRYDLPGVGENLQDHLNFGPSVEVHDHIHTVDTYYSQPALAEAAKEEYEDNKTGRLAEGGAYSFSYLPLQALGTPDEERDLTRIANEALEENSSVTKGLKAQYEIIQRMIQDPKEATATVLLTRKQRYTPSSALAPGNYATILAMLSYPFSRGTSHIASTNPADHPKIQFNYLSHPLDVEILSRHILQIYKLLTLPSLSSVLKPNGNTLPPNFPRDAKSAKEIEPFLRQYGATNYHPCGTCAMMIEEFGGVVDGNLIVYGTKNVRVCDASVFPIAPRGNILSTVYAVAEKGADIVKESLQV